jgi:hypothetical protein
MPDNLIADLVSNPAFGLVPLTKSINMIPNVYGRLNQLNLFPREGVTSPVVAVEINNGVLSIIPMQKRGGPANQNTDGKRQLRYFEIPHFPLEDKIKAEDLEKVRAFGTADRLVALSDLVARKQQNMALKHFITLEFLRNGALKGLVLDASGAVILDLFTEFGITEKVVALDLDNNASDVNAKCREVFDHIGESLLGDVMAYVHCLCDKVFFDKLVNHPSVVDAYLNYQAANNPLRDNVSRGFSHQGVFFEVYPGQASDAAGNIHKFIPSAEARFFPMGTAATFATFDAPADFLETVGTEGQAMYSKLFPDERLNQWLGIHTQSNPLPICLRPSVLVRGTAAAAQG